MRIALLIHVHTNPDQVARLVSRLSHEDVDIYINVDAKVDIDTFQSCISGVYFLKNRVEVIWGRFSQVEQILNSFAEIASLQQDYSHILFISGQDYLVKPVSEIVDFLQKNQSISFINYFKLGDDNWSQLMRKRYEYWFFLPKGDIRNNKYVKKILIKLGFKRKYPFADVYYGACWFCLSKEAIKYLLDFTKIKPQTTIFFRYTGCSDELYIQSVLLNSPMKDKMTNEIFRYFDWSDNGKSPRILDENDFEKIKMSDAWFARKLDTKISSPLMDMLDTINTSGK